MPSKNAIKARPDWKALLGSDLDFLRPLIQAVIQEALPPSPDFDKYFYSTDAWRSVASGYRYAGEVLCEAFENSKAQRSRLLFPILFCYRHFLELSLKDLVQLNAQLPAANRVNPPMGHTASSAIRILVRRWSPTAPSSLSPHPSVTATKLSKATRYRMAKCGL